MHSLRLILRHNRRQPFYAFINLIGLILGFTAFLLIALFVHHELSYDTEIPDYKRIYYVSTTYVRSNGEIDPLHVSRRALGPEAVRQLPMVEKHTDIWNHFDAEPIAVDSIAFNEPGITFASREFFDIFRLNVIAGDPSTWLEDPDKVVISQSAVEKYFPQGNPIGRTLLYNTQEPFVVSGVVEDIPQPSHLGKVRFFFPLGYYDLEGTWEERDSELYLRLAENADPSQVEADLNRILDLAVGEKNHEKGVQERCSLVPLQRIHLDTPREDPIIYGYMTASNPSELIHILVLIGILILLIAGLNYINLTTARSLTRSRLAAMLSLLGGSRFQLAGLFLAEGVLFALLGFLLALPTAGLLLPYFGQLVNISLGWIDLLAPTLLSLLLAVALLFGLLAGFFPALHFSATPAMRLLRNPIHRGSHLPKLRAAFVVLQFVIGVVLIELAIVNVQQMQFINQRDLGYDEDRILAVKMPVAKIILKKHPVNRALREEFASLPGIESFTTTAAIPNFPWGDAYLKNLSDADAEWIRAKQIPGDADVADKLGFRIVAGRVLDPTRENDTQNGVLINETLCNLLYDTVYAGQQVGLFESKDSTIVKDVVGVVKDFHLGSLHDPIPPTVIFTADLLTRYMLLRVRPGMEQQVLSGAQAAWKRVGPMNPMDCFFLDDLVQDQYKQDFAEIKLIRWGSILALVISLLGILALANHTAERRRRELSIRKVLGAGEAGLVGLVVRGFILLILLANLIALPLGWYLLRLWLGGFSYHIELNAIPFIATFILTALLALPTVGWHAFLAARSNPADVLRSE